MPFARARFTGMTFTPDHPGWLVVPSPNSYAGRKPGSEVCGIVMHFTAAGSGKGTADYFSKKEVSWKEKIVDDQGKTVTVTKTAKVSASSHLVIDRDGTVYQCVRFADRAWHAGPATKWRGESLAKSCNVNDFTIGIEIANWGRLVNGRTYTNKAFTGALFSASDGTEWEAYPDAQIAAVIAVTKVICAKYPVITRADIQGHEQIQSNKSDPGPAFPWTRVLDGVFGDDDDDDTVESLNAIEDDDRRGYYDDDAEMCLVEPK